MMCPINAMSAFDDIFYEHGLSIASIFPGGPQKTLLRPLLFDP